MLMFSGYFCVRSYLANKPDKYTTNFDKKYFQNSKKNSSKI